MSHLALRGRSMLFLLQELDERCSVRTKRDVWHSEADPGFLLQGLDVRCSFRTKGGLAPRGRARLFAKGSDVKCSFRTEREVWHSEADPAFCYGEIIKKTDRFTNRFTKPPEHLWICTWAPSLILPPLFPQQLCFSRQANKIKRSK